METQSTNGRSIAIVGAGVAGLATIHELQKSIPDAHITIWEQSGRAGGLIQTYRENGFLVEHAADCLYTFPTDAVALCRELGLESRFVAPNPTDCLAAIWERNSFHALPSALLGAGQMTAGALFRSTLLSPIGKLRCCLEPLIRRRYDERDESCRSFFTRRLGREFSNRIFEPVMSAIHAMPCDRLSMQSTMPHFVDQERKYGSLVRGSHFSLRRTSATTADPKRTSPAASVTFPNGMQELIQGLVAALKPGTIHYGQKARSVNRIPSGLWRINLQDGSLAAIDADAVVLACPAKVACGLVQKESNILADELRSIPYQPVVVIALAFEKRQFKLLPNSHGIFMGRDESYPFRSLSISSAKFAGRAALDQILLRISVHPSADRIHDTGIVDDVISAVQRLFQISGPPVFQHVVKHESGLAQYEVGHPDKIARIDTCLETVPGLFVTGSGYRGAGVVRCIQDAKRVAKRVASFLRADVNSSALE